MITSATPVRSLYLWSVERLCIIAAVACGLWTLIGAAQTHFYNSLPVPSAPAVVSRLPGDAGDAAGLASATPTPRQRLRPGEWVAKLEAPAVGLTATVIEGSTDDMLARAAGHIENTPLPDEGGNVGIAGHRDTTFRPVRKLAVGDTITLTTGAGRFNYRIVRTFVVKPDAVSVLDPTPTPTLTLVTCYPFTFIGHAPMRYIVQAELQGQTGS
jgi:LPXTG-site transpeptidase (sortase) family protein